MEDKEFIPYQESFELKKLGYDEGCFAKFNRGTFQFNSLGGKTNFNDGTFGINLISAPTFSQAFRFFRDKHNLEYRIIKSANGNYSAVIHLNTREYLDKILTLSHACVDEVVDCYSYEEVELECLRKLIQIVKNK